MTPNSSLPFFSLARRSVWTFETWKQVDDSPGDAEFEYVGLSDCYGAVEEFSGSDRWHTWRQKSNLPTERPRMWGQKFDPNHPEMPEC